MTDRQELIALRISLHRVAEKVGLRQELPYEKLVKVAEEDRGWNNLAAEIRGKIEDLQKERDAAINANYESVQSDLQKWSDLEQEQFENT